MFALKGAHDTSQHTRRCAPQDAAATEGAAKSITRWSSASVNALNDCTEHGSAGSEARSWHGSSVWKAECRPRIQSMCRGSWRHHRTTRTVLGPLWKIMSNTMCKRRYMCSRLYVHVQWLHVCMGFPPLRVAVNKVRRNCVAHRMADEMEHDMRYRHLICKQRMQTCSEAASANCSGADHIFTFLHRAPQQPRTDTVHVVTTPYATCSICHCSAAGHCV